MNIHERMPEMLTGINLWEKYPFTPSGLVDGAPVSSWADSSGNGHTATNTGSARPTFKTNILNGKPVVRFTEAALSGLNLASPVSSLGPWTHFIVMKGTVSGRVIGLAAGVAGTPLPPFGSFQNTDSTFYFYDQVGTASRGVDLRAVWVVATIRNAGYPSMEAWANGNSLPLSFAPTANPVNFSVLGFGDGDFAEQICYNSVLSDTNRTNVEKYLGTKYGITVAGGSAVDPSTVAGLQSWWKADSLL